MGTIKQCAKNPAEPVAKMTYDDALYMLVSNANAAMLEDREVLVRAEGILRSHVDAMTGLVAAVKAMLAMEARAHNFPPYTPPADVIAALKEVKQVMAELEGRGDQSLKVHSR